MTARFIDKGHSGQSTLVNRNVTVNGHRTSMRLEPSMWDALDEICRREGATIHKLCSMVDSIRAQSSLTAAMRVFILTYFRAAENAATHQAAQHDRKSAVPLELIVQMSGTPARP